MHLTKESKYALTGMAFLATRPEGSVIPLVEVAKTQALPATFLAKIFQKLARHGLLIAERGRASGYSLAREPASITMQQIFEAVEGSSLHQRCLLWEADCSEDNPCPLHYRLRDVGSAILSILENVTLADYVSESSRRPTTHRPEVSHEAPA